MVIWNHGKMTLMHIFSLLSVIFIVSIVCFFYPFLFNPLLLFPGFEYISFPSPFLTIFYTLILCYITDSVRGREVHHVLACVPAEDIYSSLSRGQDKDYFIC